MRRGIEFFADLRQIVAEHATPLVERTFDIQKPVEIAHRFKGIAYRGQSREGFAEVLDRGCETVDHRGHADDALGQ